MKVLTPAQKQVMDLVCEGHSAKEIARILNRSYRTVEHHRADAMSRLGAKNEVHAGVLYVKYKQLTHVTINEVGAFA